MTFNPTESELKEFGVYGITLNRALERADEILAFQEANKDLEWPSGHRSLVALAFYFRRLANNIP